MKKLYKYWLWIDGQAKYRYTFARNEDELSQYIKGKHTVTDFGYKLV